MAAEKKPRPPCKPAAAPGLQPPAPKAATAGPKPPRIRKTVGVAPEAPIDSDHPEKRTRRARKAGRVGDVVAVEPNPAADVHPAAPPEDASVEPPAPQVPPAPPDEERASAEAHAETPAEEPGPPPDPLALLLPQHRKLVEDSGISAEVAAERGYQSVEIKEQLKTLGFAPKQCGVPALLVPLYSVNGQIAGHQIRRDVPRVDRGGKALKYEFPKGARMVVDVPPRVRAALRDPKVPLIITEGVRKADSAASRGLACIALLGVWNWRGTNEDGGKTILPDFESIALNGRTVYLAFDSDVVTKKSVRDAMARLKAALKLREAKVEILRLPDGPNGEKVGLDDYLATGKSNDDLLALAQSDLPPAPAEKEPEPYATVATYVSNDQGLVRIEYGEDGAEAHILLANFDARIVANVIEDDGVTRTHHFHILAKQGERARSIEVPAIDFASMEWVPERCGSTFIVSAGFGNRDHARAAIQTLSGQPEQHTTYLHTGWRAFGADWAYIHAGGAIGARGEIPGVRVRLPDVLAPMRLPAPPEGEQLVRAVRALLCLIGLAPDRVSVPIFCAAVRPVLCAVDVSLQLTGLTGVFKTEAAALVQQCYGAGFGARTLPGSWSSTGNALEVVAYAAKDAVMVVDDFVPQGSQYDAQRMHREADRLLRAQGNAQGRQRLAADSSMRPTRWPRGMIVSTGEDSPAGHSLRARMVIVELTRGDIPQIKLTECQAAAREGLYAAAISGYVRWLASRREGIEARVRARVAELRAEIGERSQISHRRTTDSVAQFYVGIEYFAEFAEQVGALDRQQVTNFKDRCLKALLDVGGEQAEAQDAFDPAAMFVRLLGAALSGGQAHLCGVEGGIPSGYLPESVGWRRPDTREGSHHQPCGLCIGWILEDELFLDPATAMKAAQGMAEDTGRIPLTTRALGVRLFERKYLASADRHRKKYTTRRVIQNTRRDLLHLERRLLVTKAHEAQSAQDLSVDDALARAVGPTGPDGPGADTTPPTPEGEWGAL